MESRLCSCCSQVTREAADATWMGPCSLPSHLRPRSTLRAALGALGRKRVHITQEATARPRAPAERAAGEAGAGAGGPATFLSVQSSVEGVLSAASVELRRLLRNASPAARRCLANTMLRRVCGRDGRAVTP